MIDTMPYYLLVCDECGARADHDQGQWEAHDAVGTAVLDGWREDGAGEDARHICPECQGDQR